MTTYPLVFYPHALTVAWRQKPPIPEFHGQEPQPPVHPVGVNWKLILIEAGLASTVAAILGPIALGIGATITAIHLLLEQDSSRRRRKRFRAQVTRYEKELQTYLQKEANHRIYCEATQDPRSIAEYQYQLVLAALKTAEGYDLEIGYDLQESGLRREVAEEFFEPYLRRYFTGKIVTKAALSHSGCQDIYVPKFAYVDAMLGLHINIEIDAPYTYVSGATVSGVAADSSANGQPTHYQGDPHDGDRNDFFFEKGWLTIRFAEEQVMRYPQSCCKTIAREIFKIAVDSKVMRRFERVIDLPEKPQWSWAEAKDMAHQHYRLSYLNLAIEEEEQSNSTNSRELLRQASQALLDLN